MTEFEESTTSPTQPSRQSTPNAIRSTVDVMLSTLVVTSTAQPPWSMSSRTRTPSATTTEDIVTPQDSFEDASNEHATVEIVISSSASGIAMGIIIVIILCIKRCCARRQMNDTDTDVEMGQVFGANPPHTPPAGTDDHHDDNNQDFDGDEFHDDVNDTNQAQAGSSRASGDSYLAPAPRMQSTPLRPEIPYQNLSMITNLSSDDHYEDVDVTLTEETAPDNSRTPLMMDSSEPPELSRQDIDMNSSVITGDMLMSQRRLLRSGNRY